MIQSINNKSFHIRRFFPLRVPSGEVGSGIRSGSARYVDGINVGGRGRNREAKARRRKKRSTGGGKGKGSKGRVRWESIFARHGDKGADDDAPSKQGASRYTRAFPGRPPD